MRSEEATCRTRALARELLCQRDGDPADDHGLSVMGLLDDMELTSLDARAAAMLAAEAVRSVVLLHVEQVRAAAKGLARIGIAAPQAAAEQSTGLLFNRIDSVVDALATQYDMTQYLADEDET